MRVTAEVIQRAPTYLNPVKERELDLRACKIAVIENLGATKDQFDCIDLSDNEIVRLENFPVLNRLRTLLLNNNKLSHIERGLGDSIANLETLVLTNNKLNNLGDLDALVDLPNLRRLSLLDNPVTKKQYYRLYVIHKLPKLILLDFSKVKKQERATAAKLFGSEKGKKLEEELSKQITTTETKATSTTSVVAAAKPVLSETTKVAVGYSSHQLDAIRAAIQNAKSMEEVAQLEKALASGQIPDLPTKMEH